MPRPLRLEYANAWYHVMNRGAGRRNIFKTNSHREKFLDIVMQAIKLFGVEVHTYCLMDNHYHLLIKTPRANLSRTMRHINGVYTQYFNREMKTDGQLFRGRYKAIIIDGDDYLLQVSRYIHLNPVEARILNRADKYLWSSYMGYLQPGRKVSWLMVDEILAMISKEKGAASYRKFVECGLDEETEDFYRKTNRPVFFGKREDREKFLKKIESNKIKFSTSDYKRTQELPTIQRVLRACSEYFNVSEEALLKPMRGKINEPRKVAIYGSRVWSSENLSVVAERFSCRNHSSISNTIRDIDDRIKVDRKFYNDLLKLKGIVCA